MGGQQSRQSFEADFKVQQKTGHPYFRDHSILTHKKQKQKLLRKHFIYPREEANNIRKEFEQQKQTAFSLITPTKVIFNEGKDCYCSQNYEIYIYFEWIQKTLQEQIAKQGKLDNARAMFLLGQLSKGLVYMEQRNRAHWSVAPNTVFINSYENHFLYDSLYVIGTDPSNFLNERLNNKKHQCPLTPNAHQIVCKGKQFSLQDGLKEDMYDLGLTMLSAVTGVKLSELPRTSPSRQNKINKLLESCIGQYDKYLLGCISGMLKYAANQRLTNHELRKFIDPDMQAKIIQAQSRVYSIRKSEASQRSLSNSKRSEDEGSPDNKNHLRSSMLGPRLVSSESFNRLSESLAAGKLSKSTSRVKRRENAHMPRLDESREKSTWSIYEHKPELNPKVESTKQVLPTELTLPCTSPVPPTTDSLTGQKSDQQVKPVAESVKQQESQV